MAAGSEPRGLDDCTSRGRPSSRENRPAGKKRSREPRARGPCALEAAARSTGGTVRGDEAAAQTAEAVIDELAVNACSLILLLDMDRVRGRLGTWCHELPRVRPFVAVAGSPDRALLHVIREAGCGFFCSTADEVRRALELGVGPQQVILTSPCAPRVHLAYLRRVGVHKICFDGEAQLRRIAHEIPNARLLLALAPDDKGQRSSRCAPRFGAPADQWGPLLKLAQELRLRVVGVSLQSLPRSVWPLGAALSSTTASGGLSVALEGLASALQLVRRGTDALLAHGLTPEIADISAGFLAGHGLSGASGHLAKYTAAAAEQVDLALPAADFARLSLLADAGPVLLGQGGASLLTRAPVTVPGEASPASDCVRMEQRRAMAMQHVQEQIPGVLGSMLSTGMMQEEPRVLRSAGSVQQVISCTGATTGACEWLLWCGLGAAACRVVAAGPSPGGSAMEVVKYGSNDAR